MADTKDGGPAFPQSGLRTEEGVLYAPMVGMSLRDWFAGQALAGLLANPSTREFTLAPHAAYIVADAMLKQRQERG